MINKLELTCFRKHEERTIAFTGGLQALRAPNEGGKSTVIEAVAYALFGTKALRDSLDDVVTWGRPAKDLKVVLHYGDWVISRGKSGAEVTSMGQVHVTGQSEVTKFCEGLLGCDANTANNLMLANQTGLRGILTSGPKATAGLIEDLGQFDLFDRILDAAEHKLSLGSAAVQEERLKNLRTQLESLPEVAEPEKPVDKLARLDLQILEGTKVLTETLKPRFDRLTEQYQAEIDVRSKAQQLQTEIDRVKGQVTDTEKDRDAAVVVGEIQDTTELERRIAVAGEAEKVRNAYEQFLTIPDVQRRDRAAVEAQSKDRAAETTRVQDTIIKANEACAVAQSKKVTSSTCGFCGQDVSQFPDVARLNAELDLQIETHQETLKAARARLKVLVDQEAETKEDLKAEQQVLRAVRGIEQYVERDESVIPVDFMWKGEAPRPDTEMEDLPAKLKLVRAQNDAITRGRAKVESLDGVLRRLNAQLVELGTRLAILEPMESVAFSQLVADLTQSRVDVEFQQAAVDSAEKEKAGIQSAYDIEVARWKQANDQKKGLQSRIAETAKEIEQLAFNNALVKKVRAARPIVGNKLWTMVLSSVSAIFSQMRGENSLVTKGKDGFLVNGKAATSLSGSTLDLLGLAVRCALVKTFIPHCEFLVLDEPSAACDQDRTNAMLGYVASSGFKQVLLVTHNEASESFANNLITL